jgi:hypothetical protein
VEDAVEEYWTRAAGNMVIGMGRSVTEEKTVFFEYLQLAQRADGIYYVAQPRGRPPVDFKLSWTAYNDRLPYL